MSKNDQLLARRAASASTPVGDIRGLSAMVAFELVTEKGGSTPHPKTTAKVIAAAREQGLILLSCG